MDKFNTTLLLVIQHKTTGKFFKMGIDCPDTWVGHPAYATDRNGYYLEGALEICDDPNVEIVEVEVSYRITDRMQAELFSDER